MVTVRVLVAMVLGALVAAVGALFLGEYEFDELLPIVAGPLLGLIIAEIVVSVGQHRSATMAGILAVWAAAAVLLAGYLDTNLNEPMKAGAYLSAGLAALAAGIRANDWRRYRGRSSSTEHDVVATSETRSPSEAG
ncbi:MAG: hypothetical protein U5K30_06565 [Acidimicrobiales bacterium]|nr:hypothetical protein [Acidimicrobiales bacterium]